ncbi:GrpB family protein [Lederbergia galactosidilytica]|uniref:GrpB family protein n=1 Tax=Lederbergia galactosidilytica TaxID=217031 RepID=UPI001EE5A9EE|nr:GrpB family protein [Lederbergia galactosidilytica]
MDKRFILNKGSDKLAKSTVQLVDYTPKWERQFVEEKMKIIAVIGGEISGIEHIGSTAIKGMKAKPIIDIMVGVQDLQEVPQFVKSLEKIEFEYVPKPEWSDRKFFRKGEWGQGTCHLHICEIDSMEWKEKLWFRDYLRANPQVANEYIAVKKDLAARYIQDRPTYTKEKAPFIRNVIELAGKGRKS